MSRPTEGRILQIKDRNVVRIWNSQSEITIELNVKYPMINRAVNRGCKAYGSYWRKENPEFKGRIFPQVGDVWLSFLTRYCIVGEHREYAYCVVDETESIGFRNVPYSYLTENCKYLGKSKVSIKELFDVRD